MNDILLHVCGHFQSASSQKDIQRRYQRDLPVNTGRSRASGRRKIYGVVVRSPHCSPEAKPLVRVRGTK